MSDSGAPALLILGNEGNDGCSNDEILQYQQMLWSGGETQTMAGNLNSLNFERKRSSLKFAQDELLQAADEEAEGRVSLPDPIERGVSIHVHHYHVSRLRSQLRRVRVKPGYTLTVDFAGKALSLAKRGALNLTFDLDNVNAVGFSSRADKAAYFEVVVGPKSQTFHVAFSSDIELEQFMASLSNADALLNETTLNIDDQTVPVTPRHGPDALRAHIDALEGESILVPGLVSSSRVCVSQGQVTVAGVVTITNYRLLFRTDNPLWAQEIPLGCIASLDRSRDGLSISCLDVRSITLCFQTTSDADQCFASLQSATNLPVESLWCFAHYAALQQLGAVPQSNEEAWALYDPIADFDRMGLFHSTSRKRFWRLLPNESLCTTYPPFVVIPAQLRESKVLTAASFRARERLPVVCWMRASTGVVLCRSGQPLVGLASKRSSADEQLLELYHYASHITSPSGTSSSGAPLYVIDARRRIASQGNRVIGKGTEPESNYPGVQVRHMNIHNIHEMRRSFNSLATVVQPGYLPDSAKNWLSQLEETGWLKHTRRVLCAAVQIAKIIGHGSSVLVHCSDGWDRTPQLCALAELLMDPFYRTLRGFMVLVEKEWCAFGHKFRDRCGNGLGANELEHERSPIFIQWLDCVFQVMQQFPGAFEFTEGLLLYLTQEIYSCRYGTFICNSYAERDEAHLAQRTLSVWQPVLECPEKYINRIYFPHLQTLWPSVSSKRIVLWAGFWLRHDPMNAPAEVLGEFHEEGFGDAEDDGDDVDVDVDVDTELAPPEPASATASPVLIARRADGASVPESSSE